MNPNNKKRNVTDARKVICYYLINIKYIDMIIVKNLLNLSYDAVRKINNSMRMILKNPKSYDNLINKNNFITEKLKTDE
jgi:hypothetical protein